MSRFSRLCVLLLVLAVILLAGCEPAVDAVQQVVDQPPEPTVTVYVPDPTAQMPTAEPVAEPTETTAPPPPPPPTETPAVIVVNPPPADVADWPQEVLRLFNQLRAQNGLPPFNYSPLLASAAQGHASDCSQRGSCSSTGSDGSDLDTRLARAGYYATASDQSWAMSPTPQEAYDWWVGQAPPEDWPSRMILSETYTEVGIGLAPASWGYYFVAVFARP
jgi:uncharacterized protein YkwD